MLTGKGFRRSLRALYERVENLEIAAGTAVTGADVKLTGMTAGTNTAVAATDTVNEAIAKLQAQIDAA